MDQKSLNHSFPIYTHHPQKILFAFYVISIVIRFLLSLVFRHVPTIFIDESLYTNIAKSLAAGNGITYRLQPVAYPYIFYPVLLAPLYWFPLPFDLYRVIQFYNAVLICSSVFPVYLFAKDFTGGDIKKALISSVFTLVLPDMMMSSFLMAESAIWPLSLWLIFFAYRLFITDNKHIPYGFATGLFTALLFWTKPGSLIAGFILLISAFFFKDEYRKSRRQAAFIGLGICVFCVLCFYGLYTIIFGYKFSILGLYEKQISKISAVLFAAVIEFTVLQVFLFSVACGGIFFLFPYICYKTYNKSQKSFLIAFTAALAILAIGTAAFVDTHLWDGSFTTPRLHLRYMAPYIPIMVVFSLGSSWPDDKVCNKQLIYALAAISVLMIFPGVSVGFSSGRSTIIDSVALSAWLKDFNIPSFSGILISIFTVLFFVFIIVQLVWHKKFFSIRNQSLIFFFIFLFCNNIFAYISSNYEQDDSIFTSDAVQMNTVVEALPVEALMVTHQRYGESFSFLLEPHLRKPMQQVSVDTFLESLAESDGVYTPFIPGDQSPNIGNHITPDTDTFLFGLDAASLLEFSEDVVIQKSEQDYFTLVKVPDGSRIVDTMIIGLDVDTLHEEQQAKLWIFDENRYQKEKLVVHLAAYASSGSAELIIENAGTLQTFSLTEKPKTCLISLKPGDTFLTSTGSDVIFLSYSTLQ